MQRNSEPGVMIHNWSFLTGYDKFEYAKSALSFGVLDYILKPIDEEEMEQVVKKACERIDRKESLEHQRQSTFC